MNEIELLQFLMYLIYFFSSKVVMMQKLVVKQLTNDIFSRTIYYRRASDDLLKLQPVFLFKERQLSQIFSEADVRKRSLKQLSYNILQNSLETMSGRVVLFSKNKKIYTPTDVFFRNPSNYSEQLF